MSNVHEKDSTKTTISSTRIRSRRTSPSFDDPEALDDLEDEEDEDEDEDED